MIRFREFSKAFRKKKCHNVVCEERGCVYLIIKYGFINTFLAVIANPYRFPNSGAASFDSELLLNGIV